MKYRTLGRTRQSVSEIGFGAWAIGGVGYGTTRDTESLEALETAWEHGVTFFDTADTYGEGHSEKLLAQFLKGKREKAFLATKVGWDFYHGGSRKNFDPEYVRFACEESLKRLATDRIDLYQLHNPKLEQIEEGEIFNVLDELKSTGKIRFYGVSVHTPKEALAVLHSGKAETIQLIFNLIDQRPVAELFPEALSKKVGIVAREPLACGLLTGKYSSESRFPKNDHRNRWPEEKIATDVKKMERLRSALNQAEPSLIQESLEFILSFEAVSVVIPGAKTKAQVLEQVKASETPRLLPKQIAALRNVYEEEKLFQQGFYRN